MPLILNGTTGVSGVDGSAGTPSYQGTDTNTGIFYPAADTIAFAEGGAEIARFDSSGNLGIGTTAPSQPNGTGLVVYDASLPRVTLRNSTTGTGSNTGGGLLMSGNNLFVTNRQNGNLIFEAANAAESMRIDSSGNVGIGLSSPAGRLHIVSSAGTANTLLMTGSGTAAVYSQYGNTANNFYVGRDNSSGSIFSGPAYASVLYSEGAYPMVFWTSSSERMRINANGNIGIATTSSQSALEIYRAVSTTGSLTDASLMLSTTATTGRKVSIGFGLGGGVANTCAANIGYDVTNGAGAGLGDIYFSTRNTTADSTPTERMRITSSGTVLVGRTTSTNQASVEVAGAIRVNNNTDKSADTSGTFGMFFAKGSTTVTGGGGATTIKNSTGSEAAFYLVTGFGETNKRFYDVVVTMGAGLCTVLNSGGVNTPPTRTYTSTGENLQLSLSGSASYAVRVTGFGANEAS